MAVRRWTCVGVMVALALALTATLVGCDISGPSAAKTQVSAASPTALQVAEPSPTATGGDTTQTCTAVAGSSRLGDLAISAPEVLYGFASDYMLPDGLPTDKPLTVTVQDGVGHVLGATIESRPVVQANFGVTVCNTSSAHTHRLTSYGVMLESLTPYGGQLNALNNCAFFYGRPNGTGGECASGYSPDLELPTFQLSGSAAVHATAAQAPSNVVSLPPGHRLGISFDVTPPSSPATATYRFGLGVDGAAVVFPAGLTTHPRLVAPIARRWAGDFCTTAQMQAQIPATTPAQTYYVCPKL